MGIVLSFSIESEWLKGCLYLAKLCSFWWLHQHLVFVYLCRFTVCFPLDIHSFQTYVTSDKRQRSVRLTLLFNTERWWWWFRLPECANVSFSLALFTCCTSIGWCQWMGGIMDVRLFCLVPRRVVSVPGMGDSPPASRLALEVLEVTPKFLTFL